MENSTKSNAFFDKFSSKVAKMTGSSTAFIIALGIVIVWAVTGPIFHFSDTWQLVINTGTTIITFLMVFLIQEAQNKDTMAIQLKLNELIAATKGASNRVLNIEDLGEEDLKVLKKFYEKLGDLSEKEPLGTTHSIDEAHKNEMEKAAQP
jgi:low affinity Fe/Cu permease